MSVGLALGRPKQKDGKFRAAWATEQDLTQPYTTQASEGSAGKVFASKSGDLSLVPTEERTPANGVVLIV